MTEPKITKLPTQTDMEFPCLTTPEGSDHLSVSVEHRNGTVWMGTVCDGTQTTVMLSRKAALKLALALLEEVAR